MSLLKALLGRAAPKAAALAAPKARPALAASPSKETYLARELDARREFTVEGKAQLLQHFREREARLASSLGPKESRAAFKAENEALEANAARIFAPGHAGSKRVAALYAEIANAAKFAFLRHRNFARARAAGVQKMTLMNANTGEECAWCVANEGKAFSTSDDINAILAVRCTCDPYPKAIFNPVIEGFDD